MHKLDWGARALDKSLATAGLAAPIMRRSRYLSVQPRGLQKWWPEAIARPSPPISVRMEFRQSIGVPIPFDIECETSPVLP
jgi:hypothetical protein